MKLLLTLVFIFVSTKFLVAQTTELYIVGTIHEKSKHCTSNDIHSLLTDLKPDVILLEMDDNIYKKWTANEIQKQSNESKASLKYKKANSNLQIRPFDMEGSVKYLYMNKGFERYMNIELEMDEQYFKEKMNPANTTLYEKYINLREKSFEYKEELSVINSLEMDALIKSTEEAQNNLGEIINASQSLNKHKEFYEEFVAFGKKRNNKMVSNIIKYTEEFKGKKVVVLVGYTHRYFLVEELKDKEDESSYKLKQAF